MEPGLFPLLVLKAFNIAFDWRAFYAQHFHIFCRVSRVWCGADVNGIALSETQPKAYEISQAPGNNGQSFSRIWFG